MSHSAPTPDMRRDSYNLLARTLHWLMAASIIAMLFIGVGMMSSLTLRPWLLSLHQPLGIAILLLAVVRLVNRLVSGAPPLPADLPRWQVLAARGSHWALYGLMLAMPLLGWGVRSAGGWPVSLGAGVILPPIAPQDPTVYAVLRDAHGTLAWALFALVLGHLAAALFHAWVRRDGVFRSMVRSART